MVWHDVHRRCCAHGLLALALPSKILNEKGNSLSIDSHRCIRGDVPDQYSGSRPVGKTGCRFNILSDWTRLTPRHLLLSAHERSLDRPRMGFRRRSLRFREVPRTIRDLHSEGAAHLFHLPDDSEDNQHARREEIPQCVVLRVLGMGAFPGNREPSPKSDVHIPVLHPLDIWTGARQEEGEEDLLAVSLHDARSEEHTSELQSLTNLVCRLLLEKKKNS